MCSYGEEEAITRLSMNTQTHLPSKSDNELHGTLEYAYYIGQTKAPSGKVKEAHLEHKCSLILITLSHFELIIC